jgi:hypothetical protein
MANKALTSRDDEENDGPTIDRVQELEQIRKAVRGSRDHPGRLDRPDRARRETANSLTIEINPASVSVRRLVIERHVDLPE